MGTWDATVFGNDNAADWAGDLADSGSVGAVEKLLSEVASHSATQYLEADLACQVLAAAEVVAATVGKPLPPTPYSREALEWASRHPELSGLRSLARDAAARVRIPESELRELWREDGVDPQDRAAWEDSIDDLLARLL